MAGLKDVTHEAQEKMRKTVETVQREFNTIRTGRASSALVDGIKVEYYGTPTPLKQLASISTPDPKLIVIQPWDTSVLPEIEKAILKSDIGITPLNDGKSIKLGMPQLTQERREELVKVIKKLSEDGRVSIRSIRREINDKIKALEKNKTVSEDESFKSTEEIQKLTDSKIKEIDALISKKEKELMEI
ncbi:MAG: ribosome recycling factor [Candidatus Omnitrophica bacterium]|nr:ribosome recycling factor [Candidatus Omnitrophota bacterium]